MNDDGNDKVVNFDPKRQRKLKQLKPTKQQRPMTLREALTVSLEEDRSNQAEYFDACYAKLLRIKARVVDCSHEPVSDEQEVRFDKLLDSEGSALWGVIRARGVHRWQIAAKLKLLEELLHDGQNWYDQREFFLLAGAFMDLQHPEPLNAAPKAMAEPGA